MDEFDLISSLKSDNLRSKYHFEDYEKLAVEKTDKALVPEKSQEESEQNINKSTPLS